MLGKALKTLATDLKLQANDDCAFGIYKGYLITLYDSGAKKTFFINYLLSSSESDDLKKFQLSEAIKSDLETFKISDFEIEENGITVTISDNLTIFAEYLDKLIAMLAEADIKGASHCSECGEELGENSKKVSVNLNRYALCDKCTLSLIQKKEREEEEQKEIKQSGKIGMGILGAVIGSLIAGILWCVIAYFGIFSSWMGFVLALFAVKGYDIFKGKKNNLRLILSCTFSAVFIFIFQYAAYLIDIMKTAKYTFAQFTISPFSFMAIPFDGDNIKDFFMVLAIALLFGGIAIFAFATNLLKEPQKKAKVTIE